MKDDTVLDAAVHFPGARPAKEPRGERTVPPPRSLLAYGQRHLSLTVQRGLLLLFILLQAALFTGHLLYQRSRIEENAVHILRNTALLQAQEFETSMDAMRYQMRVIGNAILLNHTVSLDHTDSFLTQELKRYWLDGVIVFDAGGDFVVKRSLVPFEQGFSKEVLAAASFRAQPLFKELRRKEVDEHLFYWQGEGNTPEIGGFALYRSVRDPQGRYLGGVVGYFSAAAMSKLLTNMGSRGFDLGPGGALAIMDRDRLIQLARIGAGSGPIRYASNLAHLMTYASDSAQVHHYLSPVDGLPRQGVFLNINQRKWVLIVGIAERDILRDWYLQLYWTLLVIGVIAVLQWQLLHYMRTNFQQRERLAQEARQDPLTGLANRRYFDEWAQGACALARRHHKPLCVLILDLDFFKQINDRYGHDGGDAVLKQVACTLQGELRSSDISARFGGEEFVIAMPHTAAEKAAEVAERIRTNFVAQEMVFKDQKIHFTASFGLALMTPDELVLNEGIHMALTRADQALYRSKQEGCNRVTVAD